jgi:hypothetical protein
VLVGPRVCRPQVAACCADHPLSLQLHTCPYKFSSGVLFDPVDPQGRSGLARSTSMVKDSRLTGPGGAM